MQPLGGGGKISDLEDKVAEGKGEYSKAPVKKGKHRNKKEDNTGKKKKYGKVKIPN